jgi:hypothetical protein
MSIAILSFIVQFNRTLSVYFQKEKFMRNRSLPYLALIVAVIALLVATPAAFAQDGHTCDLTPTIEALHHCVTHAATAGHIDNPGVANSLLKKLDAAQAALNRGRSAVAVNNLQAFVHAVAAQTGKHIAADHAAHMIRHAEAVIDALN